MTKEQAKVLSDLLIDVEVTATLGNAAALTPLDGELASQVDALKALNELANS